MMMTLFPALRAGEILFVLLSFSVYFGMVDRGMSSVVAVLLEVLLLALCVFGFQMAAVFKHQKLVGILYKAMDPDRFIAAYEPLMKRAAKKPKLESTLRNYLSIAYAARGDFDKAVELLEGTPEVTGTQAMRGRAIKYTNLCNVYVLKGDVPKAEEALRNLETLLAEDVDKEAGGDMHSGLESMRNYIRIAHGWDADEKLLRQLATRSVEPYFQVNNKYQLALYQLNKHDYEGARDNLEKVMKLGNKLLIAQKAARLLEELDEKEKA